MKDKKIEENCAKASDIEVLHRETAVDQNFIAFCKMPLAQGTVKI